MSCAAGGDLIDALQQHVHLHVIDVHVGGDAHAVGALFLAAHGADHDVVLLSHVFHDVERFHSLGN